MRCLNLTLNNFKNFSGERTFTFSDLTLIRGKNGSGKSTLCKNSILFLLYGYYDQPLSKLPFRELKEAKCSVRGTFSFQNTTYVIERTFPTNIRIWKNGNELELAKAEYQNFLHSIFKPRDYFKKFRMIDNKEGSTLLEQGETTLKRSLLSLDHNILNEIRNRLLAEKSQRDTYNRDRLKLPPHYPSEKRRAVLLRELTNLSEKKATEQNTNENLHRQLVSLRGREERARLIINEAKLQQVHVVVKKICPTCLRPLDDHKKVELEQKTQQTMDLALAELEEIVEDRETTTGKRRDCFTQIQDIEQIRTRLLQLKNTLDTRFLHLQYKYTQRDVLVMKSAIDTLDDFYSFYLKESIKTLEPIINNIIGRLGYSISFVLSERGDFGIKLIKENQEYSYADLSTGQRLLLTLAFQIAVLMEKNETGLIIADEGFSSLDEVNLEEVFSLFSQLPFQLVCVVHRLFELPNNVRVIDL